MAQKKDIRDNVLKKRNLLDEDIRISHSKNIFDKLKSLPEYKVATVLFCYVNFGSEVETITFLKEMFAGEKRIYLPKVFKDEKIMEFYEVDCLEQLITGYFGILEPDTSLSLKPYVDECEIKNMMIMPGVGFDNDGNRIGYGGGFYDKYIASHNKMFKVMVAFDAQEVEIVPCEEHDCKPDVIITESRVIK